MVAAPVPSLGLRVAALLLLLLAVGALYLLVDRVLVAKYRFYQAHLEQQQGRVAQLERMAASREPIQRAIAGIQQDPAAATQYLPQSAPSLAAAELQQRVKSVVEAVGGTLRSTQALPPIRHRFTHFRLTIAVLRGDVEATARPTGEDLWHWLPLEHVATAALPTPIRKLLLSLHR